LLLHSVGCTTYFNQPVTVSIRDAETKQPIQGAAVRSSYMTMLDLGVAFAAWGAKDGITDNDGQLILFIDPNKDCLNIDVSAKGYQAKQNMWGMRIQERLSSQGRFAWGKDFALDLYKDPEASMDVIIPNGYRGPVLLDFDRVDTPPATIGQRHFVYEASPQGHVAIQQSGLLEAVGGFTRVHARFKDGTEVQTIEDPFQYNPPEKTIALWFITPVWEHHTWVYILGTKAEAEAAKQMLWGDGNHFDELAFKRISGRR